MNKKITFSVVIPAFNEEKNIKKLIDQIVLQKINARFLFKKIYVLSDGSTDNTVHIVKSITNKKIVLKKGIKRIGKQKRLNNIFKSINEDILVLLDADIRIDNKMVLNNLLSTFVKSKNVGLVAGNAQPTKAENLVQVGINNFVYSLNYMKSKINKENNILSMRGPICAVSHSFAKKIILPKNVPDDRYMYLLCKENGYTFKYAKNALVWFKNPLTIKDQINQGLRFKKDKENLYKYFEKSVIEKEYFIPFSLKVKGMFIQVIRNPIAYLVMKYIHILIQKESKKSYSYIWEQVTSTKYI